MNTAVEKQYNEFAKTYAGLHHELDKVAHKCFQASLEHDLKDKAVLDIGCGDGSDLVDLFSQGARCYGIDISEAFIQEATTRYPKIEFRVANMNKLPYEEGLFDVVISKYALQSSANLAPVFSEIHRVLKPKGVLLYLTKHPFRQFLEKKKNSGKNYFSQELVESKIFNGAITLIEPSHTLNEYFSDDFLKKFELVHFEEASDFPSSTQVDGDVYPTFFVVKSFKR